MGKKVFVVPPQSVSVNVSVNVNAGQVLIPAQHSPTPVQPPAPAPQPLATSAQVDTAVTVGSAHGWGVAPAPVPAGPYTPPFSMPKSDVLRRKVPMLARRTSLGLGDHVHAPACAETGCGLLAAAAPERPVTRPWAVVGWLLVAVVVWVLQYSFVLPLAYLGAVAKSGPAQALGWFAILLCGLGPFYSLFFVCSPAVPRAELRPWGLDDPR
jgi:hypothetical protein